jgi:hypothetical protein
MKQPSLKPIPLYKPEPITNLMSLYNGVKRVLKRKGVSVKDGKAYHLSVIGDTCYLTDPKFTNIHYSSTSELRVFNRADSLGVRWKS